MPVNIPAGLPAVSALRAEKIFVMTEKRALAQGLRPLEIGLVNLMPTKIVTETQFLRLLSNSPFQIEVHLLRMGSHVSKNTDPEHLKAFYRTFDQIKDKKLDGLIITGAPIETLNFEDVNYWEELCQIMEWSKKSVQSTYHSCWGAQAALYYHYGVNKGPLDQKLFGIFLHKVLDPTSRLLRGFDDEFFAPHSRHTGIKQEDLERAGISVLSISQEAGVYIAANADRSQIFVTGHPEYDRLTLDGEYRRDIDRGLNINPPVNYYPGNDPAQPPGIPWRAHGNLLFANWLNYYVLLRNGGFCNEQ